MYFSKDFIRKIVEATNLVDLISENGITLSRSGTNFKGLCPFHAEKTPSFHVNPIRGYFYCFGCNISGDGIKFLIQFSRFSFNEAIEELARRANIPIEKKSGFSQKNKFEEDEGLRCLREATSFYRDNLYCKEGEITAEYLRKRMVPENMMDKFDLGTSLNEWNGVLNCLKEKKKFS